MKSIILHSHEVNTLSETGIVTVIRPVKIGKYSVVQRKWYGKHPGGGWWGCDVNPYEYGLEPCADKGFECPFATIGEVRWARETLIRHYSGSATIPDGCTYLADLTPVTGITKTMWCGRSGWEFGERVVLQANHMPEWASRFKVECTGIEVKQIDGVWSWITTHMKVG